MKTVISAISHQRHYLCLLILIGLLSGCNALPGMQNLNTDNIPVKKEPALRIEPTLIPITAASLLSDPSRPYRYRIGPQDVLSVSVWNHPEFNPQQTQTTPGTPTTDQTAGATGYLVDAEGNIYLPLIGNVHVAGKTIAELRPIITKRLSTYIRSPQLFLRVVDFRSRKVYVMGEVLKPGFLPLNDQPLSITAAVNMAGSLDPNASDPRHIYVIRGNYARPEIYWLNVSSPAALLLGEHFQLQDNDIVVVSTATVTRWNRFLNQLLPTLQTIWYTKAITNNPY